MYRARQILRNAGQVVLATACIALMAGSAPIPLRPNPAILANAPPELLEQLRADPFTYFRFINRAWIERVCEMFADVSDAPIVRLHGDAHIEQFAVQRRAWGLDDFDDYAHGPFFIDVVRYLGSLDLATRELGRTRDRDAVWSRFLEGYRRGLSDSTYRAPEPRIVRRLLAQAPATHAAFLAWGESLMQPMDATMSQSVLGGLETLASFIRRDRPDLAPEYFAVVRMGWLRMGVGSSALRKVLIRVQGPTPSADDDVLLEAKEAANLDGLGCLETSTVTPAARIIDAEQQLGRLKHEILAVGPRLLIPATRLLDEADRRNELLDWWISSWEPTYRELHVHDLQSVEDLADIAFDSGVQLGAGEPPDAASRKQVLSSVVRLDRRIRSQTETIVGELLAAWRELPAR
jgi:hypothetical protein